MMIFRLSTASDEQTDSSKVVYETLGFKYKRKDYPEGQWLDGKPYCWVQDGAGPIVEVNTVEELLEFCGRVDYDLVVSLKTDAYPDDRLPQLLIYDGYLE